MTTVTRGPNNVFAGERNCQLPVYAPGALGAVIGTLISAVAPEAVAGTFTIVFGVIAVPLINAKRYPASHAHVPLLRSRQTLSKVCPVLKFVPSGAVTSVTNRASFVQPTGVEVNVAVGMNKAVVAVAIGVGALTAGSTEIEMAAGSLATFALL